MSNEELKNGDEPDVQRLAGRQLVVQLSALIFVLTPGISAMIFSVFGAIKWFGLRDPLDGFEVILLMGAMLISLIIGMTIGSLIWRFFLTFYITVDELKELDKTPAPKIPYITPVYKKLLQAMLSFKIWRERE